MRKISIIITIAIVSLLTLAASCTVTPGGDEVGGASAGLVDGGDSNPFANPGVEPDDDGGDVDVEVESADETETETDPETEYTPPETEPEAQDPLEITTEIDEEYTHATIGDEDAYEADFRVLDQGGYYEWTIEGVPAGSGLVFEEIGSRATRAWLHGHPTADALGTHHITVTVRDAYDATNSDSIEYDLVVTHEPIEVEIKEIEDPCTEPLTVVVEKLGDYTDHDVLQKGEAGFLIAEDVAIKVKAMRGDKPAKGKVSWEWASVVEGSEHYRCHEQDTDWGGSYDGPGASQHEQEEYDYEWIRFPDMPPPMDCHQGEKRFTSNPTWKGGIRLVGSNTLVLTGSMLYDGPLPVRDRPLDQHAIERLTIKATDECGSDSMFFPIETGNRMKLIEGMKTFRLSVKYPKDGDPGGDLNNIEVKMNFEDVRQIFGSSRWDTECNGDFSDLCAMDSYMVLLFTGSSGLSNDAIRDFNDAFNVMTAVEESLGYVAYDLKACRDEPQECEEKMVKKVHGVAGDIAGAKKIYLLWYSPANIRTEWDYADARYEKRYDRMDFDIKSMKFRNKYWWADYSDYQENYFDNNIVEDFVARHVLTDRPGMSDPNADGGIFRRKELAAWIEHWAPQN